MATMNISLPDQMREWVEAQAKSGKYGNVSDYMRDLIRHDQEREMKIAHMQKLVDEARAGGISNKTAEEVIATARAKARAGAV
ncbi:MAG: type II toxin-antitoxin system ParD family antitoxin [Mesorhizobium sp.]|nr:type II toxin-antitoxin system ParD family antitoxin [Mesorhizobium sp.]MCO5162875.1 type II toxin-antitoxin system ParD family antitoxin [Mesorhizobium sp.]